MADKTLKQISNIPVSKECLLELKYISGQKEIRVQEVAGQILEKAMRNRIEKGIRKDESTE